MTTQQLFLDLETFSETPITNGTHTYAANAEIMLFAYAFDEGPVLVWDCTDLTTDMPAALCDALADPSVLVFAHNSGFDRTVLRHAMPDHTPPIARWRDTMVQAFAHGLPGGLGILCEILKVPTDKAKDKEGRKFIQLFCKPRPTSSKLRRATRETHPAEWARFVAYAALDIHAMREVHKRLPMWNYQGAELALWHLDQKINDRGVCIDMDLVRGAIAAVDIAQADLAERTYSMTDGQLASTTQRNATLNYIADTHGVLMDDLQMATVERMVNDSETAPELRALLEIRLQASTSSTSKYKTLLKGTNSDDRIRGLLQFDGASRTGRWAGRLAQPQNWMRPTLKQEQIMLGIEAIKAGCTDLLFDNVMEITSNCIRGSITAPAGKKLVVADLSNIEGRVQAWLAGEAWKLKAFRDFDAGNGPDLYKLAYGKSFGVDPKDVTKDQRQIGKVQELALAYAGGVGAFVTFASAYGIDLDDLAKKVLPVAPGWAVDEAQHFLEWMVKQGKVDGTMSEDAFVSCDTLKRVWRNAHPEIVALWAELDAACNAATSTPGTTFACRKVRVRRDGNWLRIGLPSGRSVCYPAPELSDEGLSYMGLNQYSRKWCRLRTYSGKLFENICQAVARDVMATNMAHIEGAGYEIVISVHDELITESLDEERYNEDHLSRLLAACPAWAADMPLAAAGFQAYRYRKD